MSGAPDVSCRPGGASPPPDRDCGASMRLLMVSARYAPFVGGTEIHTAQVATELAGRGHRVTVLTTDLTGGLPARERGDGVEIVRVRARPRRSDLYWAPDLRGPILDGSWDLVHVQGYHTAVAPLALRTAQSAGLPTVLTFHSGGHSSRVRNLLRPLQVRLLGGALRRADALVAVSRFEAELFSRRIGIDPARIHIIPNGVDRTLRTGGAVTADPDAPGPPIDGNADGDDERTILSVGRLVRYKGHHRIIKAMPKILEAEPRTRLLVLGRGPYEPNLRRLADRLGVADRVRFDSVPSDRPERMEAHYAAASVAVVLSDYESHGMVAHEALGAGVPLVVLDRSALGELAATGSARAVPPRATGQEVAEIVVRCLREADRPDAGTRHAPGAVTPLGPTWSEITDQLLELYRGLAVAPTGS